MAENRELALVLKLVADQFQSELKKSQGALSGFNDFIKDWKTQLTAAGTALFAVAQSTANFGEEALKGAQKAGQTVETFTALSYAAKLADIDQQQLIVGLKSLSQNMVEAARQTGDGEAVFRRLGVSAVTTSGQLRPTEQVLLDLAEVFAQSADGAGKTEAAVKLFGKSGLELVPFLNQGKAGIAELMVEAKRLGVVLSTEDAQAANKFNDEIKRLESATRGLTLQVGKELIPSFTQLLEVMTQLVAGPGGQVMKGEIQGLAAIFTLLNHGVRETAAELDVFWKKLGASPAVKKFWDDALAEGRKALDAETSRKLHDIFQDSLGKPGGAPAPSSRTAGAAQKPQMGMLADQEKLGKALLEIHLANNRAIDIENKLRTEGADIFRLQTDRQLQRQKEDDEYQEHQGKLIVESTSSEVRIREEARLKEQQGLVDNLQAWRAYYDQVGGSAEFRYTNELDLVRATLAQQTQLTTEEAGRLLIAWQNHDQQLADSILSRTTLTEQQRETIMLRTMANVAAANQQVSNDVFAGWARGMQNYVQTTKSGFDMASDMARRTAQAMEQSFRSFFFDLFEGKVKSMKDVLRGFTDFVKQVAAQVASQLAVSFLLKSFSSGGGGGFLDLFSGFFGGEKSGPSVQPAGLFGRAATGGAFIRKFAMGGPVLGTGNLDTIPALLTPGEFVLSRRDVSDIKQGLIGQPVGPANVTVNVIGAPQDSTASVDVRRTTDSMVIDVLLRHQRDLRPLFGGA